MSPRDDRETDAAFANALLDSAMADAPAPDALGRELERLGLGTVAVVVAGAALAGSTTATTAAAASKVTAASFFSAMAVKLGIVAAIAVAGASYAVLRAPTATTTPTAPRAVTSVASATAPRAPSEAAIPSAETVVSTEVTVAASPSAKHVPPAASSAPAAAAPEPSPSQSTEAARALAAEVSLVDRARAEARRSPDAALALLDEHARTFPAGALRDEAAVVRVEALLAANRRADAERVARPYLTTRAGTPLARRMSDLLGPTNRTIP